MTYPSINDVESAGHEEICYWYRFLPSPGLRRVGCDDFDAVMTLEAATMTRIAERLRLFGGFTAEISKRIGWDQ